MITLTITDSGEQFKLDPHWIEKVYRDNGEKTTIVQIKQELHGIPPLKMKVRDSCQSVKEKIKDYYNNLQVDIFSQN